MKDQFNIPARCSEEEFAEEIKKRVGDSIAKEDYASMKCEEIFEAVNSYLGISDRTRLLGIKQEINKLREKAAKYDELLKIAKK